MNNLQNNIKKVMTVFLLLFLALISYISYNALFKSEMAINSVYNKRFQAERDKVLRGTIYDKNMAPLTKGEKTGEFSQTREYLGGEALAHVVGYYDIRYGMSGVERKFDEQLSGKTLGIKDFFNPNKKDKVGNNVVTTLDLELQKAAYDILGDRKGSIVALNPKTGEVLAMVSKPGFNPNNIQEDWEQLSQNQDTPFLNRAVSGLYPPGSTFKIVTGTSALENITGVDSKIFKDNGKIQFNESEYLENYKGKAFGNIDLEEAFYRSSNVVFGELAMELGSSLRETAEKFYFNKDIQSRTLTIDSSVFPDYKNYEKGNIAQSGIGQSGVLASPIEMALIASAISNNGVMMEPNVVSKIIDNEGKTIKSYEPKELTTVTTSENAEMIKKYMKSVVTKGTGTKAKISGVDVCGKTGTADTDSGDKIPHSWFVGFAPYENPEIAFAIISEEGGNDSYNATNMAQKLMKAYFK